MVKIDHKNAQATAREAAGQATAGNSAGQAAVELAVFGAILIFLLGTIVRSATGNSFTQNENLKTMRMAMLASWNGSKASSTAYNSASVLFVEDRLSPDFNKYGDLDRNPYIANGSGSFTYEMLYPLNPNEVSTNLPVMDVYINGQHFPFSTAAFVAGRQITPPTCGAGGPYETFPLTPAQCQQNQCLRNQREWVKIGSRQYKLFYTIVANAMSTNTSGGSPSTPFVTTPPVCANPNTIACVNKALSTTLVLPDKNGIPFTNTNGEMEYDLLRNGDYAAVDAQFPAAGATSNMRSYIAWQWAADLASVQGNTNDGADPMIQLDPTNNQYPTYDIDGRLKEVTIYSINVDNTTGYPTVSYEDPQGGDIDSTWDSNSCTPKPGLQNDSEIFTFTKNGTYLQIKEGQLYNPQTGQVVGSVNQRNSIDLIQRTIQLSNNTGRFCNGNSPVEPNVLGTSVPNPVEACVDGSTNNCFNGTNIALTCFDSGNNMLYVRSRLENRGGNNWMTNTAGQLQVH